MPRHGRERERTHFHSNRNEYVGNIKAGTELHQQQCNGRARRKKKKSNCRHDDDEDVDDKKKIGERGEKEREIEKLFFFCDERDFNEFANVDRGGNISNVVYGGALLPLGFTW